jgi:CheY-like chemotaxis protein
MKTDPNGKLIRILLADDDADDRMLARDAFDEARLRNQLDMVEDGEELMDYLEHRGKYSNGNGRPRPNLILLDLNMPKKDGREALKEIKGSPELRNIPVVVLTTSKADEDILKTYDLGVNSYINKPVTFDGMVDVVKTIGKYWFQIVELPPDGN